MTTSLFPSPRQPLPDLSGHNCAVCGKFGSFGFGPPKGIGRWYCQDHKGVGEAWWGGLRGELASTGITAPGEVKKPISLDDLVVEVDGKPVERVVEARPTKMQGKPDGAEPERKQGSLF